MSLVKCPKCNQVLAEEIVDEVDIGVGTLRNINGYECESCGPFAICQTCGAPDDIPHSTWCKEMKVWNDHQEGRL